MTMSTNDLRRGVLLKGRSAIADYLGLTEREVDYQTETNAMPVFHLGRSVVAKVDAINRWVDQHAAWPAVKELKAPMPVRPPVRRRRYG
jgi:hypothetical protein